MIEFKRIDESPKPGQSSPEDEERNEFSRALDSFRQGVKNIWPGGGVSAGELDDLEAALLRSDVSMRTVDRLLDPLREDSGIDDGVQYLRERILKIFHGAGDTRLVRSAEGPTVYFFVGVNGSGKTTSIAKLAHRLQPEHEVLFAAADTFRAAAVEQLEEWAGRLGTDVIAHEKGGDPSAVVYDAVEAAVNRDVDFLFVDTAGRLHTRDDLVDQLAKMIEVASNKVPGAPHESLLVLDASTGQNGLRQVKTFADHLPVTGLILTKLDSTARGGVALTVADELGVPVKLVGTGETLDDLVVFQPEVYCDSLLEGTATPR